MMVLCQILGPLVLIYATFLVGVLSLNDVYSHTWAVKVPAGESVAKEVADKHGFEFVGRVSGLTLLTCTVLTTK